MTNSELKQKEERLLEITRTFCAQKLDNDYLLLCEKLIRRLGQEKEVPFQRGKIEIWAAAVVHAIGSMNFLFDDSFEPHVTAGQICEYFQTKRSSVSNKARVINEMIGLYSFHPEFSTGSMEALNPFKNVVLVDGFIVHMDNLPEELQEMVKEARSNGGDIEFHTDGKGGSQAT
jgi:hypothetical protein